MLDGLDELDRQEMSEEAAAMAASLRIVNPADLEFVTVPQREWIVRDWLPVGCTTANYGDGGVGKTLLAQQLMTSCATVTPWCGHEVMPCRSFGVFCEDDEAELHRRQDRICDHLGIRLGTLGNMRWISELGLDNTLATFTADGRMLATKRYEAIETAAKAHGARLVVLDTAADLFAGNENDRHQVRRFIGLLNRLALEINGAVLLNAHPSRTGLNTGNLDGGSTGWNNSVRSRWSLARPAGDNDNHEQQDTCGITCCGRSFMKSFQMTILGFHVSDPQHAVAWTDSEIYCDGEPAGEACKPALNAIAGIVGIGTGPLGWLREAGAAVQASVAMDNLLVELSIVLRSARRPAVSPRLPPAPSCRGRDIAWSATARASVGSPDGYSSQRTILRPACRAGGAARRSMPCRRWFRASTAPWPRDRHRSPSCDALPCPGHPAAS